MNTNPAALAEAHAELSAAVAKLAPEAHIPNRVVPGDDVVYRYYQHTRPSPADRQVLGRMARALRDLVEKAGYTFIAEAPGGGSLGQTNHKDKTVKVDPELQDRRFVGTMIHELAHIRLLHLRRGMYGGMGLETAETEAESVAYIVGRALGLNLADFSAPYVANWCRGDMYYLTATRERVIRTAQAILADL